MPLEPDYAVASRTPNKARDDPSAHAKAVTIRPPANSAITMRRAVNLPHQRMLDRSHS
ncbi:hypothetical protein [Nocardia sp. NPDC050710]|uniref:hypothetical protein n=1 Tax=Nocardia sp. NPDC050710 TaxID=3157220 RepID=UPI0033ED0759